MEHVRDYVNFSSSALDHVNQERGTIFDSCSRFYRNISYDFFNSHGKKRRAIKSPQSNHLLIASQERSLSRGDRGEVSALSLSLRASSNVYLVERNRLNFRSEFRSSRIPGRHRRNSFFCHDSIVSSFTAQSKAPRISRIGDFARSTAESTSIASEITRSSARTKLPCA